MLPLSGEVVVIHKNLAYKRVNKIASHTDLFLINKKDSKMTA